MKLYHYIPYWLTWAIGKIVAINPDPKSKWVKYFGEEYNEKNFLSYINDLNQQDPTTFWLMIIAPNAVGLSVILLIILIINAVG